MSRLQGTPPPEHVEYQVSPQDAVERAPMPRVPTGFHTGPRYVQRMLAPLSWLVMHLGLISLALALSMTLLGAPRAVVLSRKGGAIQTYSGSFQKQAGTGNQDINLPAGCPDPRTIPNGGWAMQAWSGGSTASAGSTTDQGQVCLGWTTGPTNSFATGTWQQDALTTNNGKSGSRIAAKFLTSPSSANPPTIVWEADFVSFPTASTFRIDWTTNTAQAVWINFTIIIGTTNAYVKNWTTTATGAGSKSVTGVGFRSDLVLHMSTLGTAMPESNAGAYIGMGMMNKHGQQAMWTISAADAVSPSNSSRWQQMDACLGQVGTSESAASQGHFSSMDADGFTVYWSSQTWGSTRQYVSLCLQGVSSKIGVFFTSTTAAATTVTSRHGFTVRGAMLAATGATGAPATNAVVSLGFYDGATNYAGMMADQDNANPSNALSWYESAKSIRFLNSFGGPSSTAGAITSATTSGFTLTSDTTQAAAFEVMYLLLGDSGTNTFPTSIGTPGHLQPATATAAANQKSGVTLSDGSLVVQSKDSSNTTYFFRTTDGVTWTDYGSGGWIAGWSNGSIHAYVDSGLTERLVAVWKQTGTAGGTRTDGDIYLMTGAFNGARTSITWGTAVSISQGNTVTALDYPDLVTRPDGSGGMAFVVCSFARSTGPQNYALYSRYTINSSGALSPGSAIGVGIDGLVDSSGSDYWGVLSANGGVNVPTYPSIDINQTDGRLHIAYSMGTSGSGKGIRYRTAAPSGGAWVFATEVEVDTAHYANGVYSIGHVCQWDGTRVTLSGTTYTGAAYDTVLHDSSNFTSFTTRTILSASTTRFHAGRPIVEPTTGDVLFLGMDGGTTKFNYARWVRATTTLGSVIDFAGRSSDWGYANGWFSGGKFRWVYTAGDNAPFAVKYEEMAA